MSDQDSDDLESAKILIQENLFEEAKKVLFRILTRIPDTHSVHYRRAKEMLSRIESIELNQIMNQARPKSSVKKDSDPTRLIQVLNKDLNLEIENPDSPESISECWNVNNHSTDARQGLDLAVGFYEMGCFADAVRELKNAERKIRMEESFLGDLGVSIVALQAQSLIEMGDAFGAKIYLEPILLEPDLPHESKIILYYTMGLAEQALDQKHTAKAWFQKVLQSDPTYKDVQQRVRVLSEQA